MFYKVTFFQFLDRKQRANNKLHANWSKLVPIDNKKYKFNQKWLISDDLSRSDDDSFLISIRNVFSDFRMSSFQFNKWRGWGPACDNLQVIWKVN